MAKFDLSRDRRRLGRRRLRATRRVLRRRVLPSCEASRVGGTCVIRGCIPKKLMRYGAHSPSDFKAAQGYGWRPSTPRLDWAP